MAEDYDLREIELNNPFVLRQLYSDLYPKLKSYLLSIGCSMNDCEDLIQDTVIDGITNIQTGKFKGNASLLTYFSSIAKFKFYDRSKKKNKVIPMENMPNQVDGISDTEETLTDKQMENVERALAQISEKCKGILEGFYYYEKSLKELADELDLSYDFIRIKKRRCMNKMKEILLNPKENGQ